MEFVKDSECTRDTLVICGHEEKPAYGLGVAIKPRIPGKTETAHDKKIFLDELLPLEEYDHIIVLFSGGKDYQKQEYMLGFYKFILSSRSIYVLFLCIIRRHGDAQYRESQQTH